MMAFFFCDRSAGVRNKQNYSMFIAGVSYLVDQLCPGNMPIFNTGAVAVIHYNENTNRSEYININAPADL